MFYEPEIEFWDGTNWITKTDNGVPIKNGFYPDNWTEKQIMEELAYARSKVKTSDWVPPLSGAKSNTYKSTLSNGQQIMLYIGARVEVTPTVVGDFTQSIFPIFKKK